MIFGCEICLVLKTILIGAVFVGFAIIAFLKWYSTVTCGYYKNTAKLKGKTILITGATSGIGKETARELAKTGAKVIIACRNDESGRKVRDEIIADIGPNCDIVVKKLDLSSQKSIREFAEEINKTEPKLDILIHNAGTAETKTKVTEDGVELTMATNHFGPFLLTHLLIDLLKKTKSARIVVVASELYRLATINLKNINPTATWFPAYYYYVSKYANILFTRELARRLEGTGITANCLHPGMIDSGIWRNVPFPLDIPVKLITKGFFKTPYQGCQTSIYLAASDELEGITGKYFMDCKERALCSGAMDDVKAKKLWELSEKIVNLKETDPKI